MTSFIESGRRFRLNDPTLAPNAASYLWNRKMMIQMSARGYAVSQYMDPEPRKYAHVPTIAAQTFMQPEQDYFPHHPGRFFYVRDNDTGDLFSAPYEPVRARLDHFSFEPGISDIRWVIEKDGVRVELRLDLPVADVAEIWSVRITNLTDEKKSLSLVPFFPVGYSSWMNRGGHFDADLNAIVCTSVTPYQKVEQYFKNKHLKDITFFAADRKPDHFEVAQIAFEGEGGLHNPSALQDGGHLGGGDASYENPAGIMQWDLSLDAGATEEFRFVFGPAFDKAEIAALTEKYIEGSLETVRRDYDDYIRAGLGSLEIHTPDDDFDHFVNYWLPRQVYYHGDTHRLTTDPQTRNYLQDGLGMIFIAPERTRAAILRTASQQFFSGKVPDGILLRPDTELKYINQIPHTDHAVWLVIATKAYIDETGDRAILGERVAWTDSEEQATLYEHVTRALRFLAGEVDERNLPYIAQGDWCDPMNMVGYKGKGVSGWLAEAASYAMTTWAGICRTENDNHTADWLEQESKKLNDSINRYLWDGKWYARGITDDGIAFGVQADTEGRIYLNAQSWAFLAGTADPEKQASMLQAIDNQLDTPYGAAMFAPAYAAMRDDVGRVTQKWPGNGENGAVYNHAAAFYAASLYHIKEKERGFAVLSKMLTRPDTRDIKTRGQLPLYVPNYYRGAYYQHPRTAGRSSNLFNTGTASWYYRLVIEQLCGLRGDGDGVIIDPQPPGEWASFRFSRVFRGATFDVSIEKDASLAKPTITVNAVLLTENRLEEVEPGKTYAVLVRLPGQS
ncbi:glycosyltransferase 36 [Martelella lutilitoris]|uniref:Glycosyltransferase 36 n=1 Tax=Martelella lutilitoris TaxID=2583532 RepID=A0A5C4JR25_9HYPH|nr:glycosyl hydrolase family 65 protein [Martelella lutilitoris]TNB47740.1 glycosyltransferase 36 [Martelella lutilitoris]